METTVNTELLDLALSAVSNEMTTYKMLDIAKYVKADKFEVLDSKDYGTFIHLFNSNAPEKRVKLKLGDSVDLKAPLTDANAVIKEVIKDYVIYGGVSNQEGAGFGKPWFRISVPSSTAKLSEGNIADLLGNTNVDAQRTNK